MFWWTGDAEWPLRCEWKCEWCVCPAIPVLETGTSRAPGHCWVKQWISDNEYMALWLCQPYSISPLNDQMMLVSVYQDIFYYDVMWAIIEFIHLDQTWSSSPIVTFWSLQGSKWTKCCYHEKKNLLASLKIVVMEIASGLLQLTLCINTFGKCYCICHQLCSASCD